MKPSSHLLALLVIITPEDRTPDAVTASEARQSFLKTTRRTGDTHGVALKPPLAGWRGIRRVRALRVGLCQAAARREQRAADAQNIINSSAPITAKTDTTAGKLTAALKSLMDGSPVLFLLDDPFAPIPAIRQTAPNHERLHGEPQTRYWTSSCDQPQCAPAQRSPRARETVLRSRTCSSCSLLQETTRRRGDSEGKLGHLPFTSSLSNSSIILGVSFSRMSVDDRSGRRVAL